MRTFINILKFIWCLPATVLIWLFYVVPLWVLGETKFYRWWHTDKGIKIPIFYLAKTDSGYGRLWKDWIGWAGPWVMILKGECPITSLTVLHEAQHCDDQAIWGPLFYPAYILHSIYIWLFLKDKHAYLDNYFERRARRAAYQIVDIPRERWGHGPDNRWPWW